MFTGGTVEDVLCSFGYAECRPAQPPAAVDRAEGDQHMVLVLWQNVDPAGEYTEFRRIEIEIERISPPFQEFFDRTGRNVLHASCMSAFHGQQSLLLELLISKLFHVLTLLTFIGTGNMPI